MLKVKVCGVKNSDIVPLLNKLTPDYVGFILSSGFKRSVDRQTAKGIKLGLDGKIKTVGVFVNEDINTIVSFLKDGIIDVVQLHGDEDENYIAALKKLYPVTVIKSVGVEGGKVLLYPDNCDYLLLDAYDRKLRGGTGKKVEWRSYPELTKPYFLAGGITAENVAEAVKAVKPYGVDSSGGLETDGEKDAGKVERYIKNARAVVN
jgi:phosphoribosylanthranilate isomerase